MRRMRFLIMISDYFSHTILSALFFLSFNACTHIAYTRIMNSLALRSPRSDKNGNKASKTSTTESVFSSYRRQFPSPDLSFSTRDASFEDNAKKQQKIFFRQ